MSLLVQDPAPVPGSRLRRLGSLLVSASFHASVLSWVAFGPPRHEKAQSLYDQVIKPNEHRIVWYNLREKLPDVSPAEPSDDPRPPKAETLHDQTIVSKAPGAPKANQMIWLPEPEIVAAKELPSPNVLAFARAEPKPVRDFTPPPPRPGALQEPVLPDAPQLASSALRPAPVTPDVARPQPKPFAPPPGQPKPAASLPDAPTLAASNVASAPLQPDIARPQPRAFSAPPERPREAKSAALPVAPELSVAMKLADAPVNLTPAMPVRPAPRTFVPPLDSIRGKNLAAPALPAAPELQASASAALPAGMPQPARPQPRAFVPPSRAPAGSPSALPAAPELNAATTQSAALPLSMPQPARPQPRAFVPPSRASAGSASALPAAPEMRASTGPAASAAIVGLRPAAITEVPRPEGSRPAEFSAGPQLRPEGGSNGNGDPAAISVPGLLVRGGAKDNQPTLVARALEPPTSLHNLAAATRAAPPPAAEPAPPAAQALRVSSPPHPRLEGRIVYSIAVQMPNVTSYSGSWILWFAERERAPGTPRDIRAPVPVLKVDPKYVASAIDERVEGKVRLAAVIRKNGKVEAVALLQGLDPRLDRSAQEALGKWEFQPAERDGAPVDVDTVVEIPFRLAPKAARNK